jgi:hypothetical protein
VTARRYDIDPMGKRRYRRARCPECGMRNIPYWHGHGPCYDHPGTKLNRDGSCPRCP